MNKNREQERVLYFEIAWATSLFDYDARMFSHTGLTQNADIGGVEVNLCAFLWIIVRSLCCIL